MFPSRTSILHFFAKDKTLPKPRPFPLSHLVLAVEVGHRDVKAMDVRRDDASEEQEAAYQAICGRAS